LRNRELPVVPKGVEHLDGIDDGENPILWIASHGFESRSTSHLALDSSRARTRLSLGFDFPDESDVFTARRIAEEEGQLTQSGFTIDRVSDFEFERILQVEFSEGRVSGVARVVADISCMNRNRIASLILACCFELSDGFDLDVIYFPSSFESHKHAYESLESLGPVHNQLSGWSEDTDLPLSLMVGMGTEPGRAEGIMEFLEPDIISLFEPVGDNPGFAEEIRRENKRVIDVASPTSKYLIRDPLSTYGLINATIDRLSTQSRLIIVPMGPKLFCALSITAALAHGVGVGVWKASAGKGIEPVDVKTDAEPVIVRMRFRRTLPPED
jgi:hypothetical protein